MTSAFQLGFWVIAGVAAAAIALVHSGGTVASEANPAIAEA
jgi:hypothetical protein